MLSWYLLTVLATLSRATIEITDPAAGSSYIGGGSVEVAWTDSGTYPTLSALTTYVLNLCAGGNDIGTFECSLAALSTDGSFSWGNYFSATIPAAAGADAGMGYFIQMISLAETGATLTNYTPRFTLSGMTGGFSPTILAGLNDLLDPLTAGSPASIFDDSAGPYAVPYDLQTGTARYAPMQPVPGSKITATSAAPLWPTSFATIARTWLPPPTVQTTYTQSGTWSIKSRENTAAADAGPSDEAMARWSNRWKD